MRRGEKPSGAKSKGWTLRLSIRVRQVRVSFHTFLRSLFYREPNWAPFRMYTTKKF